ncbi:MAG: GIY-YIG nuclease family protein [Nodosilinea sp.]
MTADLQIPVLAELDFIPYCNEAGLLPPELAKVVGVYAIYDGEKTLQFVGYSRDLAMSLKQHLVRCPALCHWVKVQTIERPNRTLLDSIQAAWLQENGVPPGNGVEQERWTQPIDVKIQMTSAEQAAYAAAINEAEQIQCLKKVARRVEAERLAMLTVRGIQEPIRFDPKLKEQGLLNIKP